MAIIECSQCGKRISDKASKCPGCGHPIISEVPENNVQIKLNIVKNALSITGDQKVTILSGSRELWTGNAGTIALLQIDRPTEITVQYHLSMAHYGGNCTTLIDPAKNRKYVVEATTGFMTSKLFITPVDVF